MTSDSPTPWAPIDWIVAAVLLLGTGPEVAATPQAPDEDPIREVQPKSYAEFRKLLKDVRSIRVTVFSTVDQQVRFEDTWPEIHADLPAADRDRVLRGLDRPRKKLRPAGWKWNNRFELHLTGKRRVTIACESLGGRRMGIRGLGDFEMGVDLYKAMSRPASRVAFHVRAKRGLIRSAAELRNPKFSADVNRLRCFELGDDDLEGITRFERVEHLDLDRCGRKLDGSGLAHVAKLRTLRTLSLRFSRIQDDDLAALAALPKLEELAIQSSTRLTGRGFAAFARHPSLRKLTFTRAAALTDAGFGDICRIPKLAVLDLTAGGKTAMTAAGLAALRHATALTELKLNNCKVGLTHAVRQFRHLPRLRRVDLFNTNTDATVLAAMVAKVDGVGPRLAIEHLFAGLNPIDDSGLEHLGRLLQLRTLSLQRIKGATSAGLRHLAPAQKLEVLSVSGMHLEPPAFQAIGALPRLQRLNASFTRADDACLAHLVHLRALRELELAGCKDITDAGLTHLTRLKGLTKLGLFVTEGYTKAGLARLEAALPECSVKRPNWARGRK